MSVSLLRRMHATLTVLWILMLAPTLLWWRNSVPFLVFVSIYTVIVDHAGVWQTTRAEQAASK